MNKTTSNTYSVSYLVQHPITKPIMERHLKDQLPKSLEVKDLSYVHGTLADMLESNMGGGLPCEVITALMKDLDEIPVAELEATNP
jgi:hypothetical protein